MRILVTGAAGFLGSHLAERLLLEGHRVIGVDNFSSGQPRNIELLSKHAEFRFVEADAAEPLAIEGSLDWVMHFASPASPPRYLKMPLQTLRVNGEGTRHLLELALAKGAKFFLASTSEVYGDPLVHPQPETYWGNVNPIGPRAIYDEAKRYAETLTVAYQQAQGVSTRIIRIFNTYGPRMDAEDGRVVTNFINQALRGQPLTIYGDGSQTRSFQYVDDLIEGIRRLMEVEYHLPVNLGNPEEYTMLELAQLIQELVGSKLPLVYQPLPQDDPRQRRPDISRAKALLGWEPRVPVREGLARTIAYFRE
ncbi:UDP-glucuronic acid decarboxylase family protein [Meiothermus sp.]|uniref:UDP-glucuronic acid decarboxylase family protein n=1 Tax=Meiothermus sp. TaxID=1955249 RepID=UPI0021DD87BE|nr:UDP-glucuronic acid decarboxylase family protein [Meiothermus sp.]GIW26060.1 MAG: epimerase [Meiothermus sp.]